MYTPYVTTEDCMQLGYVFADDKFIEDASRQVDTLTFNRIVAIGFDRLTEFQKEIVKKVVCEQAEFLQNNADAISSIFDTYSINSVSMKFGTGVNFDVINGVPMQRTTYSLLEQTGLCWRGAI